MRIFFRFLRPMAYARHKAIHAGVFGGNRRWLAIGGLAWALHWTGRLFGTSDPQPVYTQEMAPGERVVVVHEPESPRVQRKRARRQARAAERSAKAAKRSAKAAKRSRRAAVGSSTPRR